jgi:AcrR family transcriptional regulator
MANNRTPARPAPSEPGRSGPGKRPDTPSDRSNRSRLLHSATDSFAELGYEGTSLRQIADDAGVSFQLITYYFGSKEELWVATVDYLFERYLETGRGLGFTPTANLHEQFHNHLRLLLTDMLQRPQLRRIWIQEFLARSERYEKIIRPKIKHLHESLSLPYFEEVVRLGIVRRFSAQETALLWSSIIQNNVVYPYYIELLLGTPPDSAKAIEMQVDLVFSILVAEPDADADEPRVARTPPVERARGDPVAGDSESGDSENRDSTGDSGVYAFESSKALSPTDNRIKQLELENSRLKHMVGNLALEKQLLLDRLAIIERGVAQV